MERSSNRRQPSYYLFPFIQFHFLESGCLRHTDLSRRITVEKNIENEKTVLGIVKEQTLARRAHPPKSTIWRPTVLHLRVQM